MDAHSAPQAVSHVPQPQSNKRSQSEQPDATVPRSPPNQRTESGLDQALCSPRTELFRSRADAEERYHSRVQAAPLPVARPWFPHPRGTITARRLAMMSPPREYDAPSEYRAPPEYPAPTMSSDDTRSAVHFHYHGDNGNHGPSRRLHHPGPSLPPRNASAQPQRYHSPFMNELQQLQVEAQYNAEWYNPAYNVYNP